MQPRVQGGSGEERQARDVVKRDVRCVELDNVGESTRAVASQNSGQPARAEASQSSGQLAIRQELLLHLAVARDKLYRALQAHTRTVPYKALAEAPTAVPSRCTLAQTAPNPQNTALATAVKCVVLHPPTCPPSPNERSAMSTTEGAAPTRGQPAATATSAVATNDIHCWRQHPLRTAMSSGQWPALGVASHQCPEEWVGWYSSLSRVGC